MGVREGGPDPVRCAHVLAWWQAAGIDISRLSAPLRLCLCLCDTLRGSAGRHHMIISQFEIVTGTLSQVTCEYSQWR